MNASEEESRNEPERGQTRLILHRYGGPDLAAQRALSRSGRYQRRPNSDTTLARGVAQEWTLRGKSPVTVARPYNFRGSSVDS
jgi:hypothetical protein